MSSGGGGGEFAARIPIGCKKLFTGNISKKMGFLIVAWIYLSIFYALWEAVKNTKN